MKYNLLNGSNLSYIGDAYYELEIRKYLIGKNITKNKELRKISIEFVSASAHAYIFENIKDELTEEEMNVFTRGRNASTIGHRKNVDRKEHAISSGYEAVLGYLYLKEDFIRLEYLIKKSIEIVENK
ncbi:MAG: ribonuclease III [Bacilli bacterium]|nr:ribonuclease III [Bacilli bacterium]